MRSLAQVEREVTEVSLVLEHSDKLTEQQSYGYDRLLSHLMTERSRLLYILDIPAKTD